MDKMKRVIDLDFGEQVERGGLCDPFFVSKINIIASLFI